jgi:hypothetical protein
MGEMPRLSLLLPRLAGHDAVLAPPGRVPWAGVLDALDAVAFLVDDTLWIAFPDDARGRDPRANALPIHVPVVASAREIEGLRALATPQRLGAWRASPAQPLSAA